MYCAVNMKLPMAIKKRLSDNHIMEILFSEDSEGYLTPESDPSEWKRQWRIRSHETVVVSDISIEAASKTLPSYCQTLPPFTVSTTLNACIEITAMMSFVK